MHPSRPALTPGMTSTWTRPSRSLALLGLMAALLAGCGGGGGGGGQEPGPPPPCGVEKVLCRLICRTCIFSNCFKWIIN